MLYLFSTLWLLSLLAPSIFAQDAPEATQAPIASPSQQMTPLQACMQKARATKNLYEQFGLNATMSDNEIIEALEAVDQATFSPEQQMQFEQARQTLTVQARRKLYDTVGHIAYTDITKKGAQVLEDMSQAAQKDAPEELLTMAINVYHGRPIAQPIDQLGNGQMPEDKKLIETLGTLEYTWLQQPIHTAHKKHLLQLIDQKDLLREHMLYLHCFTQVERERRAQRVGKRPGRERKKKQTPAPTKKPTATEAPTPAPEVPKPAPEKNITQSKIIEASKHLSAALTRLKAAKRYTKDMEKDDKKNLKKQAENYLNENKQLVRLADHVNALAAQGPFHQERYTQLKRFSSLVGDIKREIKGIA